MITKYRTTNYGLAGSTPIEKLEFERETESFVFNSKGRRTAKVSSWDRLHDSWEVAKDWLVHNAEIAVNNAEKTFEIKKALLVKANGLKED